MAKHVTMPCGWGCGTELNASTMRAHFAACKMRPDKLPPKVRAKKTESASGMAASLLARAAKMKQAEEIPIIIRTPVPDDQPARELAYEPFDA
jgi:hypothetical protein